MYSSMDSLMIKWLCTENVAYHLHGGDSQAVYLFNPLLYTIFTSN